MPINRIPPDVHEEDSPSPETDKVPLFEKPLTPSDVGKLNRLVIPKHHAEKHFPQLHHHHRSAAAEGGTVTLLNFEDDSGRCWRFRYSYWGSSQSYVLTKGWSRYVKENRLAAGDVVVFNRNRAESRRLFIGWRRAAQGSGGSGGAGWTTAQYPYPAGHQRDEPSSLPRQLTVVHADCSPVHTNSSVMRRNSRMLRLFGVNLECQFQVDEPEPPCTPDAN